MTKYALLNAEGIVTEIREFDILTDTAEFSMAISLEVIAEPIVGQVWNGNENKFE
jgi:hypothetical protein